MPEGVKVRARELRREASKAESRLWQVVRNRGLGNLKFRRRHPVGGFMLDFYCDEAKLGIELDGGQHRDAATAKRDEQRNRMLKAQHGIDVIRLWNADVLTNTEKIVNSLREALEQRLGSEAQTTALRSMNGSHKGN
jgi:very-short-patch-repair endonuclease